jgi:hypothetical protein
VKSYPFEYSDHLSLIVVAALIEHHEVRLAVDTGASHTVIDFTDMLIAGFSSADAISSETFETASGKVSAETYVVSRFSVFGETRKSFPVSSYDFLANGLLSDINGILGLDFFQNRHFCIDMKRKEILF